jgi:hypothetical protein
VGLKMPGLDIDRLWPQICKICILLTSRSLNQFPFS